MGKNPYLRKPTGTSIIPERITINGHNSIMVKGIICDETNNSNSHPQQKNKPVNVKKVRRFPVRLSISILRPIINNAVGASKYESVLKGDIIITNRFDPQKRKNIPRIKKSLYLSKCVFIFLAYTMMAVLPITYKHDIIKKCIRQ